MVVYALLLTLLVSLCTASTVQRRDAPSYKDASLSPKERAQALLKLMTWEEKVGQMGGIRRLLADKLVFNQTTFDSIHQLQNGEIGLGSSFNQPRDVLPLANQAKAKQINSTRLGIPFITVMDSVNGPLMINTTLFPATLSMASSFNVPMYADAVAVIRDENMAIGINWVLSPELDVAKDPRNGRVGEMYGEDPFVVGTFASQYVRTMQEEDENGFVKVATTIKHFLYGQSNGGVNMASLYGGINHIFNELAAPYIKVLNETSPLSLMTSYASVDLVPMSANTYLVRDILRGAFGFEGVIMSDAVAIEWLWTNHRVTSSMEEAAKQAVRAGLQMELSPIQPAAFPTLVSAENETDIAQYVSEAALAMLELKFATGQFDKPLPTLENLESTLRAPAHLETARNISRESIVLMQNDGILPLKKTNATSIALLGPFGELINAGSYSACISNDSSFGNSLRASLADELGTSNFQYLQGVDIVDTSDESGIEKAVSAAKEAGLAVLMLGSLSTMIGEDPLWTKRTDGEFFSHPSLGFPGLQQQLLDAVLDTGVPTVLVLSGGQAFQISNSTLRANAIMHSFLGGEFTGDSIADILFGRVNPSAKLPITMLQDSGAWPIAYDYLFSDNYSGLASFGSGQAYDWQLPRLNRNDPPFPFGFGLSYTTFNTSAPTSSLQTTNGTNSVQISATVTNTGSVAGKEVVQLYFRQQYTNLVETPNKKLVGFTKVDLQPGETKDVSFNVPYYELGYYRDMQLQIDSGLYSFYLGTSSKMSDLKTVNATISV